MNRHWVDIEGALSNPASVFRSAEQVAGSRELSYELKVRILERWVDDTRRLEVAEDEGMPVCDELNLGELHARLLQSMLALKRDPS